jgi:hypothetical protein
MNAAVLFAPFTRRLLRPGAALILLAATSCASAAPFEIAAMPARFELSVKSGQRLGQSLEIQNVGTGTTELSLRSIDWTFSEDGNITYHDELLPNSCRPWVTLERKLVKLEGREKKTFRFQVEPPADAARGECRFMIAIEGVEPASRALIEKGNVGLSLPVSGRIAVAVYLEINGAEPKLELTQVGVQEIKGTRLPMVSIRNSGDAHDRLEGILDAVGADGSKFQLVPDGTPILPGQTRNLVLVPKSEPGSKTPAMVYPLRVDGSLDWSNGSFKVNAELK